MVRLVPHGLLSAVIAAAAATAYYGLSAGFFLLLYRLDWLPDAYLLLLYLFSTELLLNKSSCSHSTLHYYRAAHPI